MDKLGVLAEAERLAGSGAIGNDELRLFLLLLAGYDCVKRRGEIRRGTVSAAMGNNVSRQVLDRACRILFTQGLMTPLSPLGEWCLEEDSVLVYEIPRLTKAHA